MYHCKMFYDSWYKENSYRNKLCRNKHFSLWWFVIALISNKSRLNIVSLQKNWPSISNSCFKSLWWWHWLRYKEIQTCINSPDHLLFRRGEMSQWAEIALEWPTLFTYLLVLTTTSPNENPAHSSPGFLREQLIEIHRLKPMSSYHFTSVD